VPAPAIPLMEKVTVAVVLMVTLVASGTTAPVSLTQFGVATVPSSRSIVYAPTGTMIWQPVTQTRNRLRSVTAR
jgi:hypothetical protein